MQKKWHGELKGPFFTWKLQATERKRETFWNFKYA